MGNGTNVISKSKKPFTHRNPAFTCCTSPNSPWWLYLSVSWLIRRVNAHVIPQGGSVKYPIRKAYESEDGLIAHSRSRRRPVLTRPAGTEKWAFCELGRERELTSQGPHPFKRGLSSVNGGW